MFASKLKSLTPGSSKSTSPVPPEFEVDDSDPGAQDQQGEGCEKYQRGSGQVLARGSRQQQSHS